MSTSEAQPEELQPPLAPELQSETNTPRVSRAQWVADFVASRRDPSRGDLSEVPAREFFLRALAQGACAPVPIVALAFPFFGPAGMGLAMTYVGLAGAGGCLVVCERLLARRTLVQQTASLLATGSLLVVAAWAGQAFTRKQLESQSFQASMAAVQGVVEQATDDPLSALLVLAAGALPFAGLGLIRLRQPGAAQEIGGGCLVPLLAFFALALPVGLAFGSNLAAGVGGIAFAVAPLTMLFALGLRLGWALREALRRGSPVRQDGVDATAPTPSRRRSRRAPTSSRSG